MNMSSGEKTITLDHDERRALIDAGYKRYDSLREETDEAVDWPHQLRADIARRRYALKCAINKLELS